MALPSAAVKRAYESQKNDGSIYRVHLVTVVTDLLEYYMCTFVFNEHRTENRKTESKQCKNACTA